ncbi:hypothetical protein D9M73_285460 [compost metagenome]
MELDFQSCDKLVTGRRQLLLRVAQDTARGERHGPAILEIRVAQDPPGLRRPGQHPEGRRIGNERHIRPALHAGHVEAAARAEHGKDRAVRCVLGEQRGSHVHAAP